VDYHQSICAIERKAKLWRNPVTKKSTIFFHQPLHTIFILVSKMALLSATLSKNPGGG